MAAVRVVCTIIVRQYTASSLLAFTSAGASIGCCCVLFLSYLSMIDVADGSDVDVRLVALEDGGIRAGGGYRRGGELGLAPVGESGVQRVGALAAQSARRLQERPSERHIKGDLLYTGPGADAERWKDGRKKSSSGARQRCSEMLLQNERRVDILAPPPTFAVTCASSGESFSPHLHHSLGTSASPAHHHNASGDRIASDVQIVWTSQTHIATNERPTNNDSSNKRYTHHHIAEASRQPRS